MPKKFTDPDDIAEDIIRDVGTHLVVGLPLGLGKANHIVNALYARAAADRTISLTLFSALTLEKRSEEHTSELQSRRDLVCRLLLEKKKKKTQIIIPSFNNTDIKIIYESIK